MNFKNINLKAFSVAELIVTVTILGILAVVAFLSYTEHVQWARDSNRIANLKTLSDWLEVYLAKHDLPLPENAVEIRKNWVLIWWQWEVWKATLSSLDFSQDLKDPKTLENVSFYVSSDRRYFQLMSFMEWNYFDIPFFPSDFPERKPLLNWQKLWILTDSNNVPVQQVVEVKNAWYLDIWTDTWVYVAHFNEVWTLKWTAQDLGVLQDLSQNGWKPNSCLTWLLMNPELAWTQWTYLITDITNKSYQWYCSWVEQDPIPLDWWADYTLISSWWIDNGTFSWWTDVPSESGSVDLNNIVELPADELPEEVLNEEDDDHWYVLEQEWDDSDYKIEIEDDDVDWDWRWEREEFENDMNEWDVVKMCWWVKELDNDGYVFNNIIDYVDWRKSYNWAMIKVFEKEKKWKKWEYVCVEHVLIWKPKDFLWRLWYKAEDKDKKFYIGWLEVFFYKKK